MTTTFDRTDGRRPIEVALSAVSLIRPLTGIGQYTLNLAHALEREDDLRIRYFYGHDWTDTAVARDVGHVTFARKWMKRLVPKPYEVSRAIRQTLFSTGLRGRAADVYHEPNYLPYHFDGPVILTIHDLSYLRHPETHPELRVRIMNKLLPPAIERAAHLLADSDFTRREVIDEFGIPPERVTTTLLGVSPAFTPRAPAACEATLQRHGLGYGGFVLAVGTLEPRKNLLQAIRAYSTLPAQVTTRFPLVIVGGKGWKSEETQAELSALVARGAARHLGYVAEADLPILYSAARAFVMPSLYEGFGLPAAEAMASGVPTIVSDRASLPEVVGDAGILVDPHDIEGMREAIHHLVDDDAECSRRAAAGIVRAATFTWDRCAQLTAQTYRSVAARS